MGLEEKISLLVPQRKEIRKSPLAKVANHVRIGLLNMVPDVRVGYRLKSLIANFGSIGSNCMLRNGIRYRHGENIHLGDNIFINYGCVLLDSDIIYLDDDVSLGPGVHIYTTSHNLERDGKRTTKKSPVYIGRKVWVGGRTVILPGVDIGENSIIGAGSVVTKNVPPFSVYAGVPARKIRDIT